jgi:endonuclease/exonuclease/phosphatase family metal-dependent hydrolase
MRIQPPIRPSPASPASPAAPAARTAPSAQVALKAAPAKADVRVMTFNIRGLRGIPGIAFDRAKAEQIARTIVAQNPDVVMFQEVDRNTSRGAGLDEIDYIRDRVDALTAKARGGAVPSDVTFGASLELPSPDGKRNGRYGNAIMTRNGYTIDGGETASPVKLPGGVVVRDGKERPSEPRTALVARIRAPSGKAFTAICTHLATESDAIRDAQLDTLSALSQQAAKDGPVVLGGDFNQSSLAPQIQNFGKESGLTEAFSAVGIQPGDARRQSLVSANPWVDLGRKLTGFLSRLAPPFLHPLIDHFHHDIDRLYTSGAKVKSAQLVDSHHATDHDALLSVVEL